MAPLVIDPTIAQDGRRAALVDGARQAVADAHERSRHGPDTHQHDPAVVQALDDLGALYARISRRLTLQAKREAARISYEAADRAWSETMHEPPTFATDLSRAKMIDEAGIANLSASAYDNITDPEQLQAGADLFRDLAGACRS